MLGFPAQVREPSSLIHVQLGFSLRLEQTFQFVTKVRELSA